MKDIAWEIITWFIKSVVLGFFSELWTGLDFQMLSFLHKSSYVLSLTVEFYIKTSKRHWEKFAAYLLVLYI